MIQIKPLVFFALLSFIYLFLPACAAVPNLANQNSKDQFDLIVGTEETILDAAYNSMQYVFPYTQFLPYYEHNIGYEWQIDSENAQPDDYSYDLSKLSNLSDLHYAASPSICGRSCDVHFQFKLEESLGRTTQGSIITGYRYSIEYYGAYVLSDPRQLYQLDLIFRSELHKRNISNIAVASVY